MKNTGRNFVVKHDFNRASTHRDRKNDYNRAWDIDDEMEDYEPRGTSEAVDDSQANAD